MFDQKDKITGANNMLKSKSIREAAMELEMMRNVQLSHQLDASQNSNSGSSPHHPYEAAPFKKLLGTDTKLTREELCFNCDE